MKKTTWVIIGLSVCVVVLATALGIVLTQKQTEIVIVREPDPFTSSSMTIKPLMSVKPWHRFYLAPYNYKPFYMTKPFRAHRLEGTTVVVYHNGRFYGPVKNE